LGLAFFGVLLVFAPANAQDFQQSYKLGSNGSISIKNVSGDISINGYDGDVVTVNGKRTGRDLEKVEIEDRSSGNRVDIGVRYPSQCNCDASVDFEVRVPRSTSVLIDRATTASGNIEIKDVRGEITVSTASGDVLVQNTNGRVHASTASGEMSVRDVVGEVSAQSASGNVDVAIAKLEGTDNMKFSSASGDVRVKLPADVDAEVSMTSASGDIKTDFPLQIEERDHGPGSQAHGRLGSGARLIKISTASGDVSLMKY
jgi:DUF4097 and DUF4098 domain-containing protein YvlB